jgi:hypothetical protein
MGCFQAVKMNIMIHKLTTVIALAYVHHTKNKKRVLKSFRHHVDRKRKMKKKNLNPRKRKKERLRYLYATIEG